MTLHPRRRAYGLATLALFLLAAACASDPGTNVMREAGSMREGPVRLTVQNGDFRDAVIYAYWNGAKRRVGMVIGKTDETFEMEWRGEIIQLEIDFVGGGGFMSDRLDVYEGDHLDFVILPGGG